MDQFGETIASIATPPGIGGLGVVRVSGPEAISLADRLFTSAGRGVALSAAAGYTAHYGVIRDPASGEFIDEAIVLVMRSPRSYTGEDTVELSCHGGQYVLRRVLAAFLRAGARLAEPGEFTKRAFLSGKLDLVQVEGVIDIIQAGGEAARRAAARLLDGELSRKLAGLREDLLGLLACLEAAVDFPEEDVRFLTGEEVEGRLEAVRASLERLTGSFERGRLAREGVGVVIAGRPNVGKSSILNGLLREERAIVTEVPGTTRDVIEESMSVNGVLVRLVDTAGVRATSDPVERIGVQRASRAIEQADLVLFVVSGAEALGREDYAVAVAVAGKPTIVVLNKSDLAAVTDETAVAGLMPGVAVIRASATSSTGLESLRAALSEWVEKAAGDQLRNEEPAITRLRHREALDRAVDAVCHALQSNMAGMGEDLVSLDVRVALDALGQLLGVDAPDELMDSIFSQFCIGK